MNILIIVGVIFSVITLAISVGLILRAMWAEDMKRKERKKLLQNAVIVLMWAVSYWVLVLVMYVGCWLKLTLDTLVK